MKILLLYATYSSGTESASHFIAEHLSKNGHTIDVKKVVNAHTSNLQEYGLIILGSPSWWVNEKDGQPHIEFTQFIEKNGSLNLQQKNCLIFGLGDTTYAHFCGAVDVLEKFIREHNGQLIDSSLRVDSYYFEEVKNKSAIINWLGGVLPKLK